MFNRSQSLSGLTHLSQIYQKDLCVSRPTRRAVGGLRIALQNTFIVSGYFNLGHPVNGKRSARADPADANFGCDSSRLMDSHQSHKTRLRISQIHRDNQMGDFGVITGLTGCRALTILSA